VTIRETNLQKATRIVLVGGMAAQATPDNLPFWEGVAAITVAVVVLTLSIYAFAWIIGRVGA
jgi:hypothetical protein